MKGARAVTSKILYHEILLEKISLNRSSDFRINRQPRVFPPKSGVTVMRRTSPVTAVGPPRNLTVFRDV